MRTLKPLVLVSLVAFAVADVSSAAIPTRGAPERPPGVSPMARAGNEFAMDLYGQLSQEQQGKNLFFSPTSISMAFTMCAAGARGETEAEMAKVLHQADLTKAHAAYQQLLERWNAGDAKRAYQLRVANRLWGQKGFPFLATYLDLTRKDYGAELAQVDFVQAAEISRAEINNWVEKQTEQKIKNLMPPGSINQMTRLVLTNAIYFKGNWVKQFDPKVTRDQPFKLADGKKVQVPMMFQETTYGYTEGGNSQILELQQFPTKLKGA